MKKALIFIIIAVAGIVYIVMSGGPSEPAEDVMTAETEETEEGGMMVEDATKEGDGMMEDTEVHEESMMDDDSAMTEEEVTASVKEFVIEGKNFEFSQSALSVSKGDTVRIVFKSTEGFHDWTIPAFSTGTRQINVGQEATVEFVADKAGAFEYFCSVGSHRQLGMTGTLTVTE